MANFYSDIEEMYRRFESFRMEENDNEIENENADDVDVDQHENENSVGSIAGVDGEGDEIEEEDSGEYEGDSNLKEAPPQVEDTNDDDEVIQHNDWNGFVTYVQEHINLQKQHT
ncbi:hypothetical protein LIER_12998 [Lithospermum erythrorhizon]|uniref:Uncharacterized protein n=1 Tax=Lithospermum erythrorhizon TaxID=34254 RepID=A0AAV3PWB9_LITER